jgi:hypothetical protein
MVIATGTNTTNSVTVNISGLGALPAYMGTTVIPIGGLISGNAYWVLLDTAATVRIAPYDSVSVNGDTINGSLTFTAGGIVGATVNGMSTPDVSGTLGYVNIPQNSQSAAYTTVLADQGKHIFHPSSDANARTFTIEANATVPYVVGTAITFVNMSASVVTIAINGTDVLYLAGTGTTGSRSLAQYGTATAVKIDATHWIISGAGLT